MINVKLKGDRMKQRFIDEASREASSRKPIRLQDEVNSQTKKDKDDGSNDSLSGDTNFYERYLPYEELGIGAMTREDIRIIKISR